MDGKEKTWVDGEETKVIMRGENGESVWKGNRRETGYQEREGIMEKTKRTKVHALKSKSLLSSLEPWWLPA